MTINRFKDFTIECVSNMLFGCVDITRKAYKIVYSIDNEVIGFCTLNQPVTGSYSTQNERVCWFNIGFVHVSYSNMAAFVL